MENGKVDSETDTERFSGLTEHHSKASGSSGKPRVEASLSTQMETCMKENGGPTSLMDRESTNTRMEQSSLANGRTICSMELAQRNGLMALSSKACTHLVGSKVLESTLGMMDLCTSETGKTT